MSWAGRQGVPAMVAGPVSAQQMLLVHEFTQALTHSLAPFLTRSLSKPLRTCCVLAIILGTWDSSEQKLARSL